MLPSYLIVTAYRLNVRTGPGTGYSIVDSIPNALCVKPFEESNGWYRVGLARWVSGTYCEKVYE